MCGLIASFGPIPIDLIERGLRLMDHRGIRSKIEDLGSVILGHVRLPIQGLDTKFDQPIIGGTCHMVMVGEVFDFREIDPMAPNDCFLMFDMIKNDRRNFELGYGNVISRIFQGRDGFWAFVFYDESGRKIYMGVDYLAQKQLYLRRDYGVVASEIRPLVETMPSTINERHLSAIMKWGYDPHGETPWNEVEVIPPGVLVEYSLESKEYRSMRYLPPLDADPDLDLRREIYKAVGRRLIGDVPIGILCSGGLDSTIVLKVAEDLGATPVVFHVDNDEDEFFDSLRLPHDRVRKISLGDVELHDAIMIGEIPMDMGSLRPQIALSRAIRGDGIDVCLTGDGADELFGGYRRAREYDSRWSDLLDEIVYYHNPRLDRAMMSSTVELRTPFLSLGVIRSALNIPWTMRTQKEYLKKTFSDIVPQKILDRAKKPLRDVSVADFGIQYRRAMVDTFRKIYQGDGRER